jgi:hypothetical protein
MKISDQMLDEFALLYEKEFGEKLARVEASEIASRVLTLYQLLARKLPCERPASGPTPPDASSA